MSEKTIYVKISLEQGGTYIQPLNDLNVLVDEIREAALAEELESHWSIRFTSMSKEEYAALPEFQGH